MAFKLSSRLAVNALIWIHSLHSGEEGFTDRAIDSLQPYCLVNRVYFQTFEPKHGVRTAVFLFTLDSN